MCQVVSISNRTIPSTYKKKIENPEEFWGELTENFTWQKKWDIVLDWNFLNQR